MPKIGTGSSEIRLGDSKKFKPYVWKPHGSKSKKKRLVVYQKFVRTLTKENRDKVELLAKKMSEEKPDKVYTVYESSYQEPHYWISEEKK